VEFHLTAHRGTNIDAAEFVAALEKNGIGQQRRAVAKS